MNRAADAIIAALSVHSASGAKMASEAPRAGSSSAATPPTTAHALEAPSARPRSGGGGRARGRSRAGSPPRDPPCGSRPPRCRGRAPCTGEQSSARRTRSRALARSQPGTRTRPGLRRVPACRSPAHPDTRGRGAAHLVEGLARRVVERGSEPLGSAALAHGEQQGVPAARQQARERGLRRVRLEIERRESPRGGRPRTSGKRRAQAIAFAADTPTRSAPTSPGPWRARQRGRRRRTTGPLRRAPRGRQARRARGGGARRLPGRPLRSARAAPPATRRPTRAAARPPTRARPRSRHTTSRFPGSRCLLGGRGLAPHDQGVLAVVGVVSRA